MVGRRNPFEEIEEMMNRMSRQFDQPSGGSGLDQLTGQSGAAIDVADHGDELVVTADLPGFTKEDIDVMLRGENLDIRAERREESEETDDDDGQYIRKERRHESVNRSVTLPEEVEEENVSAQYTNGVLTVTLPKATAGDDESHSIDIE